MLVQSPVHELAPVSTLEATRNPITKCLGIRIMTCDKFGQRGIMSFG